MAGINYELDETMLYNLFLSDEELKQNIFSREVELAKNIFIEDGRLNVRLILCFFVSTLRKTFCVNHMSN